MSHKDAMARFYDAINAGNTGIVEELIAEDFVDHDEFPGITPDRDGARQFFEMMRAAFPDLRMEVVHMVAEDDLVVAHARLEGTHEGDFMGMPPTQRRISVPVADIVRFRDGLAVEHWGVTDTGVMMQQLGAIPEPAA